MTTAQFLEPLGGVEICTVEDATALAERGHRLTAAYGRDGSLRTLYEAAGVELAGPVHFDVHPRRPLQLASATTRSARLVRGYHPDVLVLTRIEHLLWGLAVSHLVRRPLVCHLHGPPVFNRMRQLGAGVSHFVAVSGFIRDEYIRVGVPPDRISVVHNGVSTVRYPFGGDDEMVAARALLGLPPDRRIVLCYGQMTSEKGIPTLARAWPEVVRAHPGALLVLVNSLPTVDDIAVRTALGQLDPADHRMFPSTLDVVPYLHASDVVAFPTTLPESFGRVVVEGMATGRPVVGSRIGAVTELLAGPMSRFLVEPNSASELATKLVQTLDWRSREPELGGSCAAWVADRFPLDKHVEGLERILLEQAAGRRGRRRTAQRGVGRPE